MRNLVLAGLGLGLAASACSRTPAPALPDAPPPPTTAPVLLVANKADNNVQVLELPGGRVLATLETGVGPHEIAVSPDGKTAVVSNYGDQASLGRTLTVVDLPTLSVAKTIDLGEYRRPHGIAFLPDGRRVIVTAEVNASVVIVDVEAGVVERGLFTSQQGSHMLALGPEGRKAWVANIASGSVTAIDLVAMTVAEPVSVVAACEGIGVTPDGSEVWTASLKENVIVVLAAASGGLAKKAELEAAGLPIRLTPTPDGKTMIVANAQGSVVQLVDVATKEASAVHVPPQAGGQSAGPVGTAVASDSKTAYVALVGENKVAVVDVVGRSIRGYLSVGRGPDGVGYSEAFVAR